MNKHLPFFIFLSLLSLAESSPKEIADYCHALSGELEACKKYLIECETQQKDFILRSQDREKAVEKDNARLKSEIEKLLKEKQLLLAAKGSLAAEHQSLAQTHAECERPIEQAEQTLEFQKALLPNSLAETLLPPLKSDDHAARLRRFLDSLEAIREFNRQAPPPVSHVIKGPDGIVHEFQIIYFGLSLAYAFCNEAEIAGMGIRQGGEWTWQWNSEWVPLIRKAFEIRIGKRPPELLRLPMPPISRGGEAK
ncbi:MAG: hypothetical protein J6X55_15225 [Victivallales bacterium]|nr:hypothetical protein [Victivallales bacterium]